MYLTNTTPGCYFPVTATMKCTSKHTQGLGNTQQFEDILTQGVRTVFVQKQRIYRALLDDTKKSLLLKSVHSVYYFFTTM